MSVRHLRHQRLRARRLLAAVAVLLPLTLTPAAAADSRTTTPLRASFSGDFSVTFSETGPVLRFSGEGIGTKLGRASVEGTAVLGEEVAPGCNRLENDVVTLTAADGSKLFLVNEAVDCVNPPHVSGAGTYTVVGGTGRFDGASGEGRVSTIALITGELPNGSGFTGTFDPLTFRGVLTR